MSWFETMKITFARKAAPETMWVKCDDCGAILLRDTLKDALWICDKCNYHFRITPDDYLRLLIDDTTFSETDRQMGSVDFLKFRDTKKYTERIRAAEAKTGQRSAIVTGTGRIDGRMVAMGIMDFRFIGGSLDSVVGEKIVRIADIARTKKLPLILITQSGGARMQESAISLMQMAKTSAAIGRLHDAGLPYIVILTNPTTGGVTASFAMLGDIHIAEPKALVGFAGPRIIKEAVKCELPEGFQKSEYVLEHGFCDMIVSRHEMKKTLATVMGNLLD